MIKDLSQSIKATLYERISSPFFGIFVLSWLVFNWRVPYVLILGDGNIYTRLNFVQYHYIANHHLLFWYPLALSIIVLLSYPILALAPFSYWLFFTSLRTKIKQKIEGKALLTIEQSNKLREELSRYSREKHEIILDMEKEIDNLSFQNKNLSKDLEKLTSEKQKLSIELDAINKKNEQLEVQNKVLKNKAQETSHYEDRISNILKGVDAIYNKSEYLSTDITKLEIIAEEMREQNLNDFSYAGLSNRVVQLNNTIQKVSKAYRELKDSIAKNINKMKAYSMPK